ncbi:MAG: hypothetical protein RI967_373 [Planctomycetota bacterium]
MPRFGTHAFVDGLHLMHGACRLFGCHWVDLRAMSASILPPRLFRVDRVHLDTSLLDGRLDAGLPAAQHAHLRALQAVGGCEVHLGTLVPSRRRGLVTTPADLRGRSVEIEVSSEKGSDVSLAVDLVDLAHRGAFEAALVVSNDGDLRRALEVARFDLGRRVGVLNPHPGRQSRELGRVSSFLRTIRRADLMHNRLPDELRDTHGVIRRPARPGW